MTGDTGLTSNIGLASNLDGMPAMMQMEAIYADARKNWKQWNQQDWVQFSKKQVQAIIDIYEKDGSADELNMLEEIQHRLF